MRMIERSHVLPPGKLYIFLINENHLYWIYYMMMRSISEKIIECAEEEISCFLP